MDNASFHKSQKTIELIESVIFLPPYSPDFNPIETFWANLKAKIKNIIHNFTSIYKAIEYIYNKTLIT